MKWTFDVTYKSGRQEQLEAHGPARASEIRTDLDKMQQGGGSNKISCNNLGNQRGRKPQTPDLIFKARHGTKDRSRSRGKQSLSVFGDCFTSWRG